MRRWVFVLLSISKLLSADTLLLPLEDRPALAEAGDAAATFETRRSRVLDRVEAATNRRALEARRTFAGIAGLESVEPLWLVHTLRVTGTATAVAEARRRWRGGGTLRDARTSRRLALDATPATATAQPWNLERVHAPALWRQGFRGEGTLVAVLDGGFDTVHADLLREGRSAVDGWDFVTNTALSNSRDPHGTAAAGLAVGKSTGVAPDASLWVGRVCCDADDTLFETTVWRAMQAALRQNARVVSMSLGVKAFENPNYELWRRAGAVVLAADALWIVSAGNRPDDPPGAPASNPPPWAKGFGRAGDGQTATITIGASDERDLPRALSSAGVVRWIDIAPYYDFAEGFRKPELCAPSDVQSTAPGGGYRTFAGTSSSTPQAAGIAALLWSARPDLPATRIAEALVAGAVPAGERCGAGRVDALRSWRALR